MCLCFCFGFNIHWVRIRCEFVWLTVFESEFYGFGEHFPDMSGKKGRKDIIVAIFGFLTI